MGRSARAVRQWWWRSNRLPCRRTPSSGPHENRIDLSIVAFPKPVLSIEQKSVAGTRDSRTERTTWMSSTSTAASAAATDPANKVQTTTSNAAAVRPSLISLRLEEQEIAIAQHEDQIRNDGTPPSTFQLPASCPQVLMTAPIVV